MDASSYGLWAAWRRSGEDGAFDALVRPLLPVLRDAARRYGLPDADADDAVQEALVDLAREPSDRPVEVGIAAWLLRTVRLRALTWRRRTARRARHETRAAAERTVTEGSEPSALEEKQVEAALAALEEGAREAVVLRYLCDLDYREMSHVLGVSEGACRVRVHRAIARLRARLGPRALVWIAATIRRGPGSKDAAASSASAVRRAVASAARRGGSVMAFSTKIVLIAGGVVALAGAAWWGSPRRGADEVASRSSPALARTRLEAPVAPPLLRGAPVPGPQGAEIAPTEARASPEEPARPAASTVPVTIDSLVEDIRREAAPDWWAHPSPASQLRAHGRVVIASAPRDVEDAIGDYLDRRRGRPPVASRGPPSPDPASVDAARAKLRTLLLGMLDREIVLERALRAFAEERPTESARLAAQVLETEPDNRTADLLLQASRGEVAKDALEEETLRQKAWHGAADLATWATQWPSKATWDAYTALASTAAPPGSLQARRDDPLSTGSVTLDARGASLYEVLRRLQILTFGDVWVAPDVSADALSLPVGDVHAVEASLASVLDEVVRHLPAGWQWAASTRVVRLAPGEPKLDPPLLLRYFDVGDLLAPATAGPPEAPSSDGAAPRPPQYGTDEEGHVVRQR